MTRHADAVRMANCVFLVNGNGVLDPRGGTYRPIPLSHVFTDYHRLMTCGPLPVRVHRTQVETLSMLADNHDHPVTDNELPCTLPAVDALARRGEDTVRLATINRTNRQ